MKITRMIEFDISPDVHRQITKLKNLSFPETKRNRSYFKQLPHFRYLVFDRDLLIGHMGIDHRVIRVGDYVYSIFGIIALCIKPSDRARGIASQLLKLVETLAREKSIDFLFLVVEDKRIYLKNGFQTVAAECSWLGIEDHCNCGVITKTIAEDFMIKQTGDKLWSDRPIDLLGYMF